MAPLHEAWLASDGALERVSKLLDEGALVDEKDVDKDGSTALTADMPGKGVMRREEMIAATVALVLNHRF